MTGRSQALFVLAAVLVVAGVCALSWQAGLIVAGVLLGALVLTSEF